MQDGIILENGFNVALHSGANPPLASLYLPTHDRQPDNADPDRILLKNLESEMQRQLDAHPGWRASEGISAGVDWLYHNLQDVKGPYASGGLAVLSSDEETHLYPLPYSVKAHVEVGERFFIKPLLNMLQQGARYILLAVSTDRFALIRGDAGSLERMELPPDVHDQFSEEYPLEYDGQPALDYHTLEGHMSPYHGHRSRDDVRQLEQRKFFYSINDVFAKHLVDIGNAPVILVSLPEHQEEFRRIANIPHLLAEGIEKDPDGIGEDELLACANAVIAREREAHGAHLVEEFGNLQAHGGASSDLNEIGFALVERRVMVLLVERGRDLPGTFDDNTGAVNQLDKVVHGLHGDAVGPDLVDAFAQTALAQDAEVFLMDKQRMPATTGMAAIYRW